MAGRPKRTRAVKIISAQVDEDVYLWLKSRNVSVSESLQSLCIAEMKRGPNKSVESAPNPAYTGIESSAR